MTRTERDKRATGEYEWRAGLTAAAPKAKDDEVGRLARRLGHPMEHEREALRIEERLGGSAALETGLEARRETALAQAGTLAGSEA